MADKDYKAFIVEGEAREPQVIDNISKVFLFFVNGIIKIPTFGGENSPLCYAGFKPFVILKA